MEQNKFPQRQQYAGTLTGPTALAPTAPVSPMMGTPMTAPMAPGMMAPGMTAPMAPGMMAPGMMAPGMMGPGMMGPGMTAPMAPVGGNPVDPPIFPPGTPVAVAPVRRIVHPPRIIETHTVTRYPIVNVYPTHTRRVHHNVYEYYCEYPHTCSDQCCDHQVDCCCEMPRRPIC